MNRKLFLLVIVLLAGLVLPAGWTAAGTDEFAPAAAPVSFIPGEPNDTFATANDAYNGYLMTPDDVDYLRIEVQTPSELETEVRIFPASYGLPDPVLRVKLALYDSAHTLLAEDTNCDTNFMIPGVDVAPGVYFLRVQACDGYFDGDQLYQVYFHERELPYDELEPNDSRANANPFRYTNATIDPAGDKDFYRFEGRAGGSWYISAHGYNDEFDLELAILAADGTVLDQSGTGFLEISLTADGVYYVRVKALNAGETGEYYVDGEDIEIGEVEPNDTPAQALELVYGDDFHGRLSETDTVDYYRFQGQAGDKIVMPETSNANHRFFPYYAITLYDPSMTPVPLMDVTGWATLPVTGVYTIAVTNPEDRYEPWYFVRLHLLTVDEPNDSMATATPVEFGATLNVLYDYPCDLDWFMFQGRAGDVLASMNTYRVADNAYLFAADGTRLFGTHVLPADGTYYLLVDGYTTAKEDSFCDEGEEVKSFGTALWVSSSANGLGGNKAIKKGDIVTRKNAAGQWQIVFDASDVGINKDVVAFERMPNGSILMSLGAAQKVPGLGKVMPHDIIRFLPTSLGDDTAGTFEWFLDGSDVGLTTTGEKIDAISMQEGINNPLRISITGAGSVPRQSGGTLKVADEDVINLVGLSYGENSAGAWRMHWDGSSVPGMAAEDVNALTRAEAPNPSDSDTYYSLASAFNIGVKGKPTDVMEKSMGLVVPKLTNKKIDGLAIGPAWTQ